MALSETELALVELDVHRRLDRGRHERRDVDTVRQYVDRHAAQWVQDNPGIYVDRAVFQQVALDVVRDLTD